MALRLATVAKRALAAPVAGECDGNNASFCLCALRLLLSSL